MPAQPCAARAVPFDGGAHEANHCRGRPADLPLLKRLNLVFDAPHVLVSGTETGGKPYLREILTWRDHDTPDNAPPEVEAVWKRMYDYVEKRDGKPSIEIEEVALLVPAGR